ncbi:MAG: phosphoglucosamine mutase [Bacteroidota bacterium]
MSLMVSISGIRGVVGTSLTPEVIVKYASAFAEYCKGGRIVLGRDGRTTGKTIAHLVSSTLLQMGCDVSAIGVCPTPTVALAVERTKAAGGIAVTASHNPMQWNGLKFFAPTGMFLDAEENRELWRIAENPNRRYAPWEKQGKYSSIEGFIATHIKAALSLPYVDAGKIRKKKFKVVLDCVDAAGGVIVPTLLEQLGCKVVPMNCEVSGVFSHTPEPVPANLKDLSKRVRKERADFGIAVDPDVDRLVLLDEMGEPIGEEYTVATAVKFVLGKTAKRGNQTVVVNLSTTRAIDDIAAAFNARVIRTAVGEINVAKKMKEIGAVVGGEGNGGVILPKVHYVRDAIVGIVLTLQHLTEFRGTLSVLKRSMPEYHITKGKVELGSLDPDRALRAIQDKFSGRGKVNTVDGLKIDFEESWVHLRKSNTEPIVRIIAEAPTERGADELVARFTKELAEA